MSLRSMIFVATRESSSKLGSPLAAPKILNSQFLIDDAKLRPIENSTKQIMLLKKNKLPLHKIIENKPT